MIRIRKDKQHNGQKKKDKQRYTKHTLKTKDRVTRTPLKTEGELMCSGRVGRSYTTSGIRRVKKHMIIYFQSNMQHGLSTDIEFRMYDSGSFTELCIVSIIL